METKKNTQIEKEETKIFFIDDVIVYIEHPKEKKLLELITNDIQGCRTQVNI